MATTSETDPRRKQALQQIFDIAQSMKALVSSNRSFSQHHNNPLSIPPKIPPLHFPSSDHIISLLKTMKLPSSVEAELCSKVMQWTEKLQSMHLKNYRRTCEELIRVPQNQSVSVALNELRQTYEDSYVKRYLPWISRQIEAACLRPPPTFPSGHRDRRKPQFHNEYTPLLEKYFEYNAYPSAPDRSILARKSMMTPRQIEVWFQNHRSRAKKEGRTLRRLNSSPLPFEISFDSLKERMPFFAVPENQGLDVAPSSADELSDDDLLVEPSCTPTHDFLNSPAPPHAFPAPFPPNITYDPFPNEAGVLKFPPPIWMRKPATCQSNFSRIDFDDFVTTFASKLNLREGGFNKPAKRDQRQSSSADRRPWYSATVTEPCRAPHPALIRFINNTTPTRQCSSQASHMHPDSFPQQLSKSQPPSSKSLTERRKIARLPNRTLSHACHQDGNSSSRSPTPYSRSTSRSSSSSETHTSSNPVTPPPSPLPSLQPDLTSLAEIPWHSQKLFEHLSDFGTESGCHRLEKTLLPHADHSLQDNCVHPLRRTSPYIFNYLEIHT